MFFKIKNNNDCYIKYSNPTSKKTKLLCSKKNIRKKNLNIQNHAKIHLDVLKRFGLNI